MGRDMRSSTAWHARTLDEAGYAEQKTLSLKNKSRNKLRGGQAIASFAEPSNIFEGGTLKLVPHSTPAMLKDFLRLRRRIASTKLQRLDEKGPEQAAATVIGNGKACL